MRGIVAAAVAGGMLACCGTAQAWHFAARFVQRVGTTDIEIPYVDRVQTLVVEPGSETRLRIQFGVFDDAGGAAPAGGYIGWREGTLGLTAGATATRTPGRLAPFNFAQAAGSNGLPSTDPFAALTGIDNTLGVQNPLWLCGPDGLPLPLPPLVVRGINAFVSTFEFTVAAGSETCTITAGGILHAASDWRVLGNPDPPNCGNPDDPSDDVPGSMTYTPFPLPPQFHEWTMSLVVPAPSAGGLLVGFGLVCARRRRAPGSCHGRG